MNALKKYICKRKLKHRYEKYLDSSLKIKHFISNNYLGGDLTQRHLNFIHFLIHKKIFFKYLNNLPHKNKNPLKSLKNNLKWLNTLLINDDFIFPLSFDWGSGKYWIKINNKWIIDKSINRVNHIDRMFIVLQEYYKYRIKSLNKL